MVKIQVDFDDDAMYILRNVKAKMQFNNQSETLHYIVKGFDIEKLEHKKQTEVPI